MLFTNGSRVERVPKWWTSTRTQEFRSADTTDLTEHETSIDAG
jgi:hypothetical protein